MSNFFTYSLFAIATLLQPLMVQSQPSDCNFVPGDLHIDLCISIVPPDSDGARMVLDNAGLFRTEGGTNKIIVESDFGDPAGGDYETDDPGWVVPAGDMSANEFLWFRARGSLRFWDITQQQWLNNPPNNERVRYRGNIPFDIVLNGTPQEIAFYDAGTIWSANGLAGPLEAPIEPAAGVSSGDAIHAHLDFCVEDGTGDCSQNIFGNPAAGVYLIEMQLFSTAVASNGQQQKYLDSPPILVALNRGLDHDAFNLALDALTVADTVVDDSAPLPAAGILIMTGP